MRDNTYLILGKARKQYDGFFNLGKNCIASSDYGMSSSLGMSRSTGSNGGGCVTAATMALTKDYTVPLQGYGYDDANMNIKDF